MNDIQHIERRDAVAQWSPSSARERASPGADRWSRSLRALDLVTVVVLLCFLSPLLVARALVGFMHSGRALARVEAIGRCGAAIHLRQFTGPYPGASLARLFNVLSGELALVGPRALLRYELSAGNYTALERFEWTPGIFSLHGLRRQTGIDYEGESGSDFEQLERHTLRSYVGILLRAVIVNLLGGRRGLITKPTVSLLGVEISNGSMAELLDWIVERVRKRIRAHLAFVNADCLNIACRDSAYRAVLDQASRVVADGIGVRLGCKMQGYALTANLNGTDLFPQLCERMRKEGLSIYLLGARPGVAEAAASAMQARYPGLRVAGTHHGYFSPEQEPALIETINASGADVLLVAMGAPRQEVWLARHAAQLTPSVRLGVGGLFDFYSGRIPRAPKWLREIGMEWSYRLYREPGRMWRRYVVGNPVFLFRVGREARRNRKLRARENTGRQQLYPNLEKAVARPLLRRLARRAALNAGDGLKRLLDLVLASLLLVALSPLMLVVAGLIRLESPGSVWIRQTRVGQHGKTFVLWKFRSMYRDAEQRQSEFMAQNEMEGGVLFKMKRDPRITRVGRLIRRTSIDELPQLWNVLRGDMTLVGPRPALPGEVSQYSLLDRRRLAVKPGITCLWQISGRSEVGFPNQVKLDLAYIHSRSLKGDLSILCRTIPAVLSGRGAY